MSKMIKSGFDSVRSIIVEVIQGVVNKDFSMKEAMEYLLDAGIPKDKAQAIIRKAPSVSDDYDKIDALILQMGIDSSRKIRSQEDVSPAQRDFDMAKANFGAVKKMLAQGGEVFEEESGGVNTGVLSISVKYQPGFYASAYISPAVSLWKGFGAGYEVTEAEGLITFTFTVGAPQTTAPAPEAAAPEVSEAETALAGEETEGEEAEEPIQESKQIKSNASDLKIKLTRLNKILNKGEGEVGSLALDKDATGYRVVRIDNEAGGQENVTGRGTSKETYAALAAMEYALVNLKSSKEKIEYVNKLIQANKEVLVSVEQFHKKLKNCNDIVSAVENGFIGQYIKSTYNPNNYGGPVEYAGKMIALIQVAYEAGTQDAPYYEALGVDAEGITYRVRWDMPEDIYTDHDKYADANEPSDFMDWDAVSEVLENGTVNDLSGKDVGIAKEAMEYLKKGVTSKKIETLNSKYNGRLFSASSISFSELMSMLGTSSELEVQRLIDIFNDNKSKESFVEEAKEIYAYSDMLAEKAYEVLSEHKKDLKEIEPSTTLKFETAQGNFMAQFVTATPTNRNMIVKINSGEELHWKRPENDSGYDDWEKEWFKKNPGKTMKDLQRAQDEAAGYTWSEPTAPRSSYIVVSREKFFDSPDVVISIVGHEYGPKDSIKSNRNMVKRFKELYTRTDSSGNMDIEGIADTLTQEFPEYEKSTILKMIDKWTREIAANRRFFRPVKSNEEFEEDGFEETPSDDDIVISDARGEGYYVTQLNEEFEDYEEMDRAIKQWMEDNQYWPNIWMESDHGNIEPYTLESSRKSLVKKAIVSGMKGKKFKDTTTGQIYVITSEPEYMQTWKDGYEDEDGNMKPMDSYTAKVMPEGTDFAQEIEFEVMSGEYPDDGTDYGALRGMGGDFSEFNEATLVSSVNGLNKLRYRFVSSHKYHNYGSKEDVIGWIVDEFQGLRMNYGEAVEELRNAGVESASEIRRILNEAREAVGYGHEGY